MKIQSQVILESRFQGNFMIPKQACNEEEKLKGISSFVKDLKNVQNSEILCYFSWLQIKKHTNFLLDYLSRQKISDKTLFFETLASFDSLLSIFKVNLFMELQFTKTFYRNIQKEFQLLCLQYDFNKEEKQQKIYEFQLYSILFLLVMLIYFSGKKELSQNKDLPLNIINKTFINNFITLEINITQKNERIVGLIIAYLIKNINIKIYGQKMLRFILNHFDKILTPRTVYHFVYCLRQIHLQRQIDIKIIRKFGLLQKLLKFWMQTFYNRQSIYLVDYINVILKKYPSLIFLLKTETVLGKLLQYEQINEFSIVHQGLILQIKAKLIPNIDVRFKHAFLQKAFVTCEQTDYSLKYLSCFVSYQRFDQILERIVPFVTSFQHISRHNQMKSIIFAVEILNKLIDMCFQQKGYSLLFMLREKIMFSVGQLKQFSVCKREIARIEESFSRLISIQYQTLY